MNNISDKGNIWTFTELTEDLKRRGINSGLNSMYNVAATYFKMAMTTVDIK